MLYTFIKIESYLINKFNSNIIKNILEYNHSLEDSINNTYENYYCTDFGDFQEYKNTPEHTLQNLKQDINFPVDIMFNTVLHQAVINNDIRIVTICLNKGCCLNVTNLYGDTPFHIAVKLKRYFIIELLNRNEYNHNILNSDFLTFLNIYYQEILNKKIKY